MFLTKWQGRLGDAEKKVRELKTKLADAQDEVSSAWHVCMDMQAYIILMLSPLWPSSIDGAAQG